MIEEKGREERSLPTVTRGSDDLGDCHRDVTALLSAIVLSY